MTNRMNTLGRTTGIGFALAFAAFTGRTNAAIQQGNSLTAMQSVTVDGGDLLNGLAPTASVGNFTAEGTSGTVVLTDGAFGDPNASSPTATGGNTAGTSVTYTLLGSATGYDLTRIDTFTGWPDDGRYQQSYTIAISTDGTTFNDLYTVSPVPTSTFGNNQAHVALTDSGNGTLVGDNDLVASGVVAIQFRFNETLNGYSGYREIDVVGTPTMVAVPEPMTGTVIAGIAASATLRRRRQG